MYIGTCLLQDEEMIEPTPQKAKTKTAPSQKRSIKDIKEVSIRNHIAAEGWLALVGKGVAMLERWLIEHN